MQLEKVSRDDWILGGAALLLVISLLFFPWFSVSVGPFTATFTATGAPDGWAGVIAMLLALAVIVDLAIERFAPQTSIPELGGSRPATRFFLAAGAAAFVALKFLLHIHFDLFGWGFYVSVIAAAALVYFSLQARRGGVSAPSMRRGGTPPAA